MPAGEVPPVELLDLPFFRQRQDGGHDEGGADELDGRQPLAEEEEGQADDEGGVEAVDDGGQAGAEPVEGIEEERVRDGDAEDAAEEEQADGRGGDGRRERLAQDGERRDDDDQRQDALGQVQADRVDAAAADPEQDDGDGPDKPRGEGEDLAERARGRKGVEHSCHPIAESPGCVNAPGAIDHPNEGVL